MKRLDKRGRRSKLAVLGIVAVAALLMVAAASAAPDVPLEPRSAGVLGFAPSVDDGGPWEVGAEAAGGNLSSYACSEATYLRNRLTSKGWVSRFLWCGSSAWEQEYKRSAAGGTEQSNLDTVDLMFYVGHGSTGSFTFDSAVDDHDLTPSDCNRAWGDGDNEWVGLTSCQVLSDPNLANWAACMNGGHQILGFITNAEAHTGTGTQGYQWAYYITSNWTVTSAWFKACDVSNGPGAKVRVLANELACYDDKPWTSTVCADSFDTDAWYWDHTCGSELPRPMDVSAIAAMPVYRTPPLSLDEAKTEYTDLGGVFNLPARPPAQASAIATEAELWSVQEGDRELEMERNSGLFTYYDMNLWSAGVAQAALTARAASISPNDAKTIADDFLKQNGLQPGDAKFFEVTTDKLGQAGVAPRGAAPMASVDTVYQVIYSRVLPTTYINAAGQAAQADFLVVGPGAKLKVYVPMTATLASAADPAALPVSGVQGGWRSVMAPATASAIDVVPIISEAQVLKAYEQVESFVVLNTPPIDADRRNVISTTLAYWEDGISTVQSELVPVYALRVEYFQGATSLDKGYAYIPANAQYMRPYAKIMAPSAVREGEVVTLMAADAKKTLAALGHDASLDFALGSGDGPYLYEWYTDSISDTNKIGQGMTFDYLVPPLPAENTGKYQQTIFLRVTDSGSADQRISIATHALMLFPHRGYLPLITKQ